LLKLDNEVLYGDGHWELTQVPNLLRSLLVSAGLSQHQQGRSSWQGRSSSQPSQPWHGRHEVINRHIPGTLQEETIEGTFIPVAGSEEQHVASWLNRITEALRPLVPIPSRTSDSVSQTAGTVLTLIHRTNDSDSKAIGTRTMATRSMMAQHNAAHHLWSSETLHKPIKDSLMVWKPDLVLWEVPFQSVFGPEPVFSWQGIISFMELTSSSYSLSDGIHTIHNGVMRKAYAIFASQPGRQFLFALSISNQEFCLHMFDCSGVVHSQPYNIHKSPHVLLHMLAVLAFSDSEHLGFDPTFVCFLPIHQQLSSSLGTICIESLTYHIVRQIFFSFLIHG